MPEPGTTISGFADSKQKKTKKINADRPQIFLKCDRKHTFFFWPYSDQNWKVSKNKMQYQI